MLLVNYLRAPEPARWKQAVFTALFGLFDRARMLSGALRVGFDRATADALPGQVRDAFGRAVAPGRRGRHRSLDRNRAGVLRPLHGVPAGRRAAPGPQRPQVVAPRPRRGALRLPLPDKLDANLRHGRELYST